MQANGSLTTTLKNMLCATMMEHMHIYRILKGSHSKIRTARQDWRISRGRLIHCSNLSEGVSPRCWMETGAKELKRGLEIDFSHRRSIGDSRLEKVSGVRHWPAEHKICKIMSYHATPPNQHKHFRSLAFRLIGNTAARICYSLLPV
jgi:hypothetical protein